MLTETRIIPGSLLTVSALTYYTAAKPTTGVAMRLVNNHTDVVDYLVYIVPPSGTAGAANIIMKGRLQVDDCFPFVVPEVIPTGYTIQARATVGSVVAISASGLVRS
jgi:hypothetical protein